MDTVNSVRPRNETTPTESQASGSQAKGVGTLNTTQESTSSAAAAPATVVEAPRAEATADAVAVALTSRFVKQPEVKPPGDVQTTQVKFDVREVRENGKTLSFRVIDAESGKVIREFPPDTLPDKLARAHGKMDEKSLDLLDVLI
jgi:uncharacterized FlaG/YvyC family protein